MSVNVSAFQTSSPITHVSMCYDLAMFGYLTNFLKPVRDRSHKLQLELAFADHKTDENEDEGFFFREHVDYNDDSSLEEECIESISRQDTDQSGVLDGQEKDPDRSALQSHSSPRRHKAAEEPIPMPECCICSSSNMIDPWMSTCGHTACGECFVLYVEESSRVGAVQCPGCSEKLDVELLKRVEVCRCCKEISLLHAHSHRHLKCGHIVCHYCYQDENALQTQNSDSTVQKSIICPVQNCGTANSLTNR